MRMREAMKTSISASEGLLPLLAMLLLLLLPLRMGGASPAPDDQALKLLPPEGAYESIRKSRGLVFLDLYADW